VSTRWLPYRTITLLVVRDYQLTHEISDVVSTLSKEWGQTLKTSAHISCPFIKLLIACSTFGTDARTCCMLSRSRKVTVLSLTESKSTVTPRGVPSSSLREYRLPILTVELSTRFVIPSVRKRCVSLRTRGVKLEFEESGTMRTLIGATIGGSERTCNNNQL